MNNPLTKEQLRERITSEIWEALNMAGADPETVASKDAIYFKTDNLLNLILQDRKAWGEYVIGNNQQFPERGEIEVDPSIIYEVIHRVESRNKLRAEQRQRNTQKENK